MNEALYAIAKKYLEELNIDNISDIEVRHVIGEQDIERMNERENNIQIDIYYKDK